MLRDLINRLSPFLLLLFFTGTAGLSQNIVVRDIVSFRPVDNVAVYNPSRTHTALTDIYGVADISSFPKRDSLVFQHAAYKPLRMSYTQLSKADYKIYLEKKSIALDEIIISATRFEQEAAEIPNRVISIPAEKVSFDNPQTTADMLAGSGEVFVQKSQLGGGSPMIRGFSANKVLIVVDGVRMNNAIFRGGNLQNVIAIDPNSLSQSEVIFGPGTVIYGSDALGGVMSFMTLEPKLNTDKKFTSSVNIMGRYASANTERTGHIDVRLSGRRFSSVTSFTSSWFDDLQMGSNGPEEYLRRQYVETKGAEDIMVNSSDRLIQKFSGYNQVNVLQKFRYRPHDRVDLTYAFQYSETSDVPRYDRLIQYANPDTLKYASWYYGPQVWMMNMLNASLRLNSLLATEMKISLAWQQFEESRHSRRFADSWFRVQKEQVDMYTANVDIEKRIASGRSLYYGLEGVYNDVRSSAFRRDYISGATEKTGTRYPDGRNDYYTLAAYMNYEHRLSNELSMMAGLRYSYVSLRSTIADTSLYSFPFTQIDLGTGALNGSAGLNWTPGDAWQLRLNIASGFRAPNLDDVAKVFDSSPGNVVVPNPSLKPEYSYNLDLGVQRKFGDRLVLEVSGFYTYLVDAMVRRDFTFNGMDSIYYDGELSQVEAVVNAGSANIYGLSAMGLLNIGGCLKFRSTISWMDGEDNEGFALRHVSPLFGSTALICNRGPFIAELYAVYNGSIPYSRLAPSERDKAHIYAIDENGDPYSPSWWTLNFKASYKLLEELTLDVGLENIFSERYRPYSSGIVAPGRNFIVALRASL